MAGAASAWRLADEKFNKMLRMAIRGELHCAMRIAYRKMDIEPGRSA
jgi:hypothetical protein